MNKGETDPTKPFPISRMLKRWIILLNETYTKTSLSEFQISAYGMALDDLSEHELEIGLRRVLRTWNFTVMPPPGFIREAVAGAMEEERSTLASQAVTRERLFDLPEPRLTLEEAWEDWEQSQALAAEFRKKFLMVEKEKKAAIKRGDVDLVLATTERLHELEGQKKFLETKYGKGKK